LEAGPSDGDHPKRTPIVRRTALAAAEIGRTLASADDICHDDCPRGDSTARLLDGTSAGDDSPDSANDEERFQTLSLIPLQDEIVAFHCAAATECALEVLQTLHELE